MQALTLMIVYVLSTMMLQFTGFLISRAVEYGWPTLGLMTFLILFMSAFGFAWPLAVRITEWMIRRAGYKVETEQSGGAIRRDTIDVCLDCHAGSIRGEFIRATSQSVSGRGSRYARTNVPYGRPSRRKIGRD